MQSIQQFLVEKKLHVGLFLLVAPLLMAPPTLAQEHDHHHGPEDHEAVPEHVPVPQYLNTGVHEMMMTSLGGGWMFMPMAQVYPLITVGAPFSGESGLQRTRFYPTQSNIMTNLEGPGSRITLRTTINLEGLTIPDGETTYGGWGEGFIDSRHPHTVLHEAVLSVNVWEAGPGALSLSAGKGFATYGVDDPMGRPIQKFPTNHHLSQLLERFLVSGTYLVDGWNLEASLFGGNEPEDPYDVSTLPPSATRGPCASGGASAGKVSVRWPPGRPQHPSPKCARHTATIRSVRTSSTPVFDTPPVIVSEIFMASSKGLSVARSTIMDILPSWERRSSKGNATSRITASNTPPVRNTLEKA